MENKKYSQKVLTGMLKTIGQVSSYKWKTVMDIVKIFPQVTIIHKEWGDDFKQKYIKDYPLDLSKIETWSTFDNPDTINFFFSIENKDLICRFKIYDGNKYDGSRTNLRFSGILKLPKSFLKILNDRISYKFDTFLNDEYDQFLKQQQREWVSKLKNEFLDIFNNSNK